MTMTYEELDAVVPQEVKLAYLNNQTHHLLNKTAGITDFSFTNLAEHLGVKMASRRMRFGVISDGLTALKMLKG
jgi:hypothetical protein